MDASQRIDEAFHKIRKQVDAITAHLSDFEIEILQDLLITGLLANKRRRTAGPVTTTGRSLVRNKKSS
jgi:hypothetical protein